MPTEIKKFYPLCNLLQRRIIALSLIFYFRYEHWENVIFLEFYVFYLEIKARRDEVLLSDNIL